MNEESGSRLGKIAEKAKETVKRKTDAVIGEIDQNGDGHVDLTDVLIMAFKIPGVRVDRKTFLQKELFKYCSEDIIDKAVETTPALAGIDPKLIDKIVDDVINFERNCVSGISAALGMPGGAAMAATIPADIAQYYGYTLRAAQKMLYLYGFPAIEISSEDGWQLDSETLNSLTLCLGVMNGVAGANNALKAIAKGLAKGVEKKILRTALTKGAVYPFIKNTLKWFGVNVTKKTTAAFVGKAIPVIGGIVGGAVTFASFKPCCIRLKNVLSDTLLSNPNHISTEEEDQEYKNIVDEIICDDQTTE